MSPRRVPSTDGVEVAVHDLGGPSDPGAPVLFFAHANGFHGHVWGPMASHLADRFRCLAIDFRGHGVSSTPADLVYEWGGFGADVRAVLADPEVIPPGATVHGIGHSMGGAALLSAQAAAPRFASIWAFEPIVPPPGAFASTAAGDENPMAEGALRRRPTFDSFDAAVDNYASKPPFSVLHPDALRAYVEHGFDPQPDGTVTLRCRPETEAAIFRTGGGNGVWDALPEVHVPVSIVIGAEGEVGPAAFGPHVADRIELGYLTRYPDLGHFGPLEDPKALADDVARWVA